MRRYAKPTPSAVIAPPQQDNAADDTDLPSVEDFDTGTLLSKSLEILRREIRNIMQQSSAGKLDANASKDLVAYIKLLSDIEADQKAQLSEMSDEEIKKAVKKKSK